MANVHTAVFVEGDTDKIFYEALIKFYREKYKISTSIKILNLRGIGKYEGKLIGKLKNEIASKGSSTEIRVVSCYDTDVFELGKKPPVNREKVKKEVLELKVKTFVEVPARKMIEDWFLCDLKGLCAFLGIKEPRKLKGKDGNEKISSLFKQGNKIYQKGLSSHKFVEKLNIELIREQVKNELSEFEKTIGLKEKQKKRNKKS